MYFDSFERTLKGERDSFVHQSFKLKDTNNLKELIINKLKTFNKDDSKEFRFDVKDKDIGFGELSLDWLGDVCKHYLGSYKIELHKSPLNPFSVEIVIKLLEG